jgi:hypothetical protein
VHRFLVLFLARYFKIIVRNFQFKYKHLTVYEQYVTARITEKDSEIHMTAVGVCSWLLFDQAKVAEVFPVTFTLILPPNISVMESLRNSLFQFEADYISAIVSLE